MSHATRHSINKKAHILLAVFFLAVLLVEWTTHGLAFLHTQEPAGIVAVSQGEEKHGYPDAHPCCQGRETDDQRPPTLSHDAPPVSIFYVQIEERQFDRRYRASASPYMGVRGIFRPRAPDLDPPEFS